MTMKNEVTNASTQPVMSSNEIANLTDKSKSDIHVDIWNMLKQLYRIEKDDGNIHHLKNQKVTVIRGVITCFDNRGYVSEFLLDRRHTEILITGYDVVRRASVIDRWFSLESGEAQPRIAVQPPQPAPPASHDILSLARVVAEATASATMKAVMEVSGANLIAAAPASQALQPTQIGAGAEFVNTDSEFTPVHKVSWETGLSDPSCRRLVQFANLPSRQLLGVRGLCVHRESFLHAFQVLLEESVRPTGKRKRWQHPEFGGFILRKEVSSGE
ncbi:transcriptional regulator [Superficieibacter electus]|uniref:Transcriptional regulator n=1 Tax=Superficieibacter electus TaxID=2022662 RepID=A0A2P5GP43_9ENTR|nr:Rha family transcriptional regulator [Superficieibacter electus]POP44955.1 transcriptional regulator [Superficieibacter electus]POP48342.1 transcriptional regulator [Superficieibacter electus]